MKCALCKKSFSYFQSMKSTLVPKVGIVCPHCEKTNYFSAKSRKQNSYFTLIIPVIFVVLLLFDIPVYFTIGITGLFALLTLFIFPFVAELTDEEEPLF